MQVLLDEGALVRDGDTAKLTRPVSELKIPPTVQGSLRHASTGWRPTQRLVLR